MCLANNTFDTYKQYKYNFKKVSNLQLVVSLNNVKNFYFTYFVTNT